jgi:hypothetical protein
VILTRRGFLHCGAGFVGATFAASARPVLPGRTEKNRCLLPAHSSTLEESFQGYRVALGAAGIEYDSSAAFGPASLIVVPAARLFGKVRCLQSCLRQGGVALVESGAAFLPPAAFAREQELVRSRFGIEMLSPVKLWDDGERSNRVPYVDFTWPVAAAIRDFSRAIPLRDEGGEVVATLAGHVVAVKQRVGAGTLIFLGTPVGPHLLADDYEALQWFKAVCHAGYQGWPRLAPERSRPEPHNDARPAQPYKEVS